MSHVGGTHGCVQELGVFEQIYASYIALPDLQLAVCQIIIVIGLGIGLAYLDAKLAHEHQAFDDAFYFASISVTTIGYGDKTFHSTTGKILGSLYLIISTLVFAHAVTNIADIPLERRRKRLQSAVLQQYGSHLGTTEDLAALILDEEGGIDRADFILRMLIMLDHVTPEEVLACSHRFDVLARDLTTPDRLTKHDVRALGNWHRVKHLFRLTHGTRRTPKRVRFEVPSSGVSQEINGTSSHIQIDATA